MKIRKRWWEQRNDKQTKRIKSLPACKNQVEMQYEGE